MAEFRADGSIVSGTGENIGTWRRESGRLTVAQIAGPEATVSEISEGLEVEGDLLRRC